MWKYLTASVGVCIVSAITLVPAPAQEGLGERLGEKIDRGVTRAATELRQEWAQIRKSVERMGVQGRVYSRLRWDKDINASSINIEIHDENVVVLQGSVRDAAAKKKAVQLARDTVGVGEVADELAISDASE